MKRIIWIVLILMLAGLAFLVKTYYPQLEVANGYAAKKMCSCTFIAKRSQESIQNQDLATGPLGMTKTKIDHESKSVRTTLFGLAGRKAVYRNDLGCILLSGKDDYQQNLELAEDEESYELPNKKFASSHLEAAMDLAFVDSAQTRAVLVVHKDSIVAERYAQGFDKDTQINGWSMTKSITATLIGILVKQEKLSLDENDLFAAWKNDERKEITLKDLLQMQSGLKFEEDYGKVTDATNMLFRSENVASVAINNELIHAPGEYWSYSSGTSNILSQLIRDRMDDDQDYHRFPYQELFRKLDMYTAIIESDESGTYVGSSFCFASPRDWAKFGLLYLNYGNHEGEQLFDSSWVDFVRKPAKSSKNGYGGHFWLNDGKKYPDVPLDMYSCNGFQGQYVFIFPSHDLVVVRMGLGKKMDFNLFLSKILEGLEEK